MKNTQLKINKDLYAILVCVFLFFSFSLVLDLIFKEGLRRYYCLYTADILCIGHSMTEMGIDKDMLETQTGLRVAKFCMNGAGIKDRLVMIKQYLESTSTKPTLIIYDVSARSFSSGLSNNSYALFYPFMNESSAVNVYIRQEASLGEYWQKKLFCLSRYDDTRLGAVVRGYQGNWKNIQTRTFDAKAFLRDVAAGRFWKITFDRDAISNFDKTLDYLHDNGIKVLLLALPSAQQLNEAEPENYEQALALLKTKCEQYPNVSFIDFNPEFSAQSEMFFDPIHLNRYGQKQVTQRLSDWIKRNK